MEFNEILSHFDIKGNFLSCEPYGSGLINRTYVANYDENGKKVRYIVQRINSKLFTNVEGLMNNIKLVTEFNRAEIAKRGGNPDRESLTLVFTKDRKPYFKAAEDEYYRVYVFIEDAKGYDVVEKPEHFYESAVAFGKFAMLLDRFDSSKLFEVLPDFHNTVKRFANFKKSLEKDVCGRAKDVMPEIEFALKHENITNKIVDLLKSGDMPSRVTHNDTKLNNVLIGCNPCLEDTPKTEEVIFNMPLFETYTAGYLSVFGNTITDVEREMLPYGAILMTYECGIRFLTDYLDGDVYFRHTREKQNVDRTRTQFKLVSDMESRLDEMYKIVKKY